MALLITEEQRMKFAHEVSDAVICLDSIQSPTSSQAEMSKALLEAHVHVDNLHGLIRFLAGDRAHELYAPDELPAEGTALVEAAGKVVCHAAD